MMVNNFVAVFAQRVFTLDDVFSDGQLDFGLDDEVRENDVNAVLDVAVVVNGLRVSVPDEHVRILKVI